MRRNTAAARIADRYLGEAFISHSVDIKLIQNLHPLPKGGRLVVKCNTVFIKLSTRWSETQLLVLQVPLVVFEGLPCFFVILICHTLNAFNFSKVNVWK